MNQETKCPNCSSTNVHLGKKGASLGKAVGGAVVAGPIGTLAGLHGSGDIEAVCLNCGKRWDPIKLNQEASRKRQLEASKVVKQWKREFLDSYESGDMDRATEIAKIQRRTMYENGGLKAVYDNIKSDSRVGIVFNIIGLGLIALMVIGVLKMCT